MPLKIHVTLQNYLSELSFINTNFNYILLNVKYVFYVSYQLPLNKVQIKVILKQKPSNSHHRTIITIIRGTE